MVDPNFSFDGIRSSERGLYIVRMDTGLIPVVFAPARDIIEEFPSRANQGFFYRSKLQNLTINLTFASFEADIDNQKLYDIGSWLFPSTYKEFYSADNIDKLLYLIPTGVTNFNTTGRQEGMFEIEYRNKFPYALTRPTIQTFDLSDNTVNGTMVQLTNYSNVYDYFSPEIEFELQSTETGFSLTNYNDNGRICSFTTLDVGETIYLNSQKNIIISDATGSPNRFSKFNGNWFRLNKGVNNVLVKGKCILQVKSQFPVFM